MIVCLGSFALCLIDQWHIEGPSQWQLKPKDQQRRRWEGNTARPGALAVQIQPVCPERPQDEEPEDEPLWGEGKVSSAVGDNGLPKLGDNAINCRQIYTDCRLPAGLGLAYSRISCRRYFVQMKYGRYMSQVTPPH